MKIAGYTTSTINRAEITPPTMGAAMRCITSAPVPLANRIGTNPIKVDSPVISMGRMRWPAPLWTPDADRVANSRLTHYMDWLKAEKGLSFSDYPQLWDWSVDQLESFYASLWEYFDIRHSQPYTRVLDGHAMPGAKWFEGARLNLAEQVFRFHIGDPGRPAIESRSELRGRQTLTWGELHRQIAATAASLRGLGVGPGDRVVAYLPNIPETVVAFLACASIGAVWSSCSPDMGTRSVLDRFQQIDPKVMIAVDGYRYGGKDFDRLDVVAGLRDDLPTLEHLVLLPYLDNGAALPGARSWASMIQRDAPMAFEQLPFDHPIVRRGVGSQHFPQGIGSLPTICIYQRQVVQAQLRNQPPGFFTFNHTGTRS